MLYRLSSLSLSIIEGTTHSTWMTERSTREGAHNSGVTRAIKDKVLEVVAYQLKLTEHDQVCPALSLDTTLMFF